MERLIAKRADMAMPMKRLPPPDTDTPMYKATMRWKHATGPNWNLDNRRKA